MKPYPKNLTGEDRRAMRRWTLIYLGLCGSIVASLFAYRTFEPNRGSNHAEVKMTVEDSGAPRR